MLWLIAKGALQDPRRDMPLFVQAPLETAELKFACNVKGSQDGIDLTTITELTIRLRYTNWTAAKQIKEYIHGSVPSIR